MIATEKFSFVGARGQLLDGRLEKPGHGAPRAVALFAHCFTCTKQSKAATRISAALAGHGIAVLRFDFTGLGASEGDFANAGFVSNVEDLVAAAGAMRAAGSPVTLLIGHSLGGAAVIAAAEHVAEVRAVVTLGAPFDVQHVLAQLGDDLDVVKRLGEADVTIGGRKFRVSQSFIDQAHEQPQAARLRALKRALLVLHSPTDATVGIDNARQIFEAARHPKSFVALDGDHLLTNERHARYAAALIAAWIEGSIDEKVPAMDRPSEGIVSVQTAGGKFAQLVRTSTHELLADEPRSIGGSDLGPTPYDFLLAALGACTSMTIKQYAERKGWPLEQVSVELEHGRNHAADCLDCDIGNAEIQVIDRALRLTGALSDEQRARLLEIADKCPVHRTLEKDLHIHTTEVR